MTEPAMQDVPTPLIIRRGVCTILYAFDVGAAVNLDRAEQLCARWTDAGAQRPRLKHRRRAPKHFVYEPAPLRITRPVEPFSVGGFTTGPTAEITLWDFGAVSIAWTIPLAGDFAGLLPLGDALYDNETLLNRSRAHLAEILDGLAPAIDRYRLGDIVEDYAVYQIVEHDQPGGPGIWLSKNRELVARLLRADLGPLSMQEADDALACRLAYGRDDEALIDWNAAILFDPEPEDALGVLEFANVELLEMRYLDAQLDESLEAAYQATRTEPSLFHLFPGGRSTAHRRIAALQTDAALLFENVNNAIKLIGDQYLARLYRLTAVRLHLPEWDAGVLRKLATLESLYSKASDRAAHRRAEILEWIIILLIAFEVVKSLVE